MKTGTIVLIPFPYTERTNFKVRPALVVCETKDKYNDLILCAISSVVPMKLGKFEMAIVHGQGNKLRVPSIIRINRIVTLKQDDVIATLGLLSYSETEQFKLQFKCLVD